MRLARSTGAAGGLVILALGIWVIFIPFVGPYFHYGFSPDTTWHFTGNRVWLNILPGLAAAIGGLILIVAAHRASGVAGGWLALLGGVWLLVGSSMSLLWRNSVVPLDPGIGAPLGGTDRAALELIGFFYGAGALIAMLAAFAIGRFASRPGLEPEPAVATTTNPPEPASEPEGRRRPIARERARHG
jgi:hypothetical protein